VHGQHGEAASKDASAKRRLLARPCTTGARPRDAGESSRSKARRPAREDRPARRSRARSDVQGRGLLRERGRGWPRAMGDLLSLRGVAGPMVSVEALTDEKPPVSQGGGSLAFQATSIYHCATSDAATARSHFRTVRDGRCRRAAPVVPCARRSAAPGGIYAPHRHAYRPVVMGRRGAVASAHPLASMAASASSTLRSAHPSTAASHGVAALEEDADARHGGEG